ncbi:S8 family serine peptidase [Dokdonella sp.]|uniref:S8 family serine peptidase n=1 Tax=Dokdonella sp. TaxID=2291710 RepID=UPI001B11668F|nr:S8 family serine peptidase [Dokdonella sp.]MBO9663637.1 S8 family serine peptidase [Dokdonella sp.]
MAYPLYLKTLTTALGLALAGAPTVTPPAPPLAIEPPPTHALAAATPPPRADGRRSYLIRFAEEGLLHYRGGVAGLAATGAEHARKFDVRAPAARAYADYLSAARDAHVQAMRNALGHAPEITHSYAITRNGVAAELDADEAARVAQLPGVVSVRLAGYEQPATMRGPAFIGADSVWNGTATPGGVATRGQGVVIGVLDTGTASAHPSFADDPACGFDAGHPKLRAVDCTRSENGQCSGPDPEAIPGFGHGVHTASTAAGNTIDNTVSPAPALADGVHMSGVAPCAAIRQYKVCSTLWCAEPWILAGIENAIADQVDVISFSISGGTDPWNDMDRSFLDATATGIFVAAAAGNDGLPLGHRGPWMTTVAASSQDRVLVPSLAVAAGGVPAAFGPMALAATSTTPIVAAALPAAPLKSYEGNLSGCSAGAAIPAGTFDGAIAVLLLDPAEAANQNCLFAQMAHAAVDAGAIAVVIATAAFPLVLDTSGAPDVPIYAVSRTSGDALLDFIAAHPADAAASIEPPASAIAADVHAIFSLTGPTPAPLQNLTKPDISAPGVLVYAALDAYDGDYGVLSGTSMATPHVAGAAALLRAVHPQWTPMELKSALMTTANDAGTRLDFVAPEPTPWDADDAGSGRVDLGKAALAGLTLDESYDRFVAADPTDASVALEQLNLPSLRDTACAPSGCSWTRTVTNRLAVAGSWSTSYRARYGDASVSVSPAVFQLAPGASQTLTITATPSATDTVNLAFGELVLSEANGASPEQHFSVAVKAPEAPPPIDACAGGDCTLRLDGYAGRGYLRALGGTLRGSTFVWLNRFTPSATDYPFTLDSVQTLFRGVGATGRICAAVGDRFDVYVYRDDDHDPRNGATLLATLPNVAVSAPLGTLQSIPLPNGGVRIDGPGDVLIALYWHGSTGTAPATFPLVGATRQRSWIGTIHLPDDDRLFADGFDGSLPYALDLTEENLTPIAQAIGYDVNFLLRASGTKADGGQLTLGEQ